jgi:hypothetical protein
VHLRQTAWRMPPFLFRNWFSPRGSSHLRQIFVCSDNWSLLHGCVNGGSQVAGQRRETAHGPLAPFQEGAGAFTNAEAVFAA